MVERRHKTACLGVIKSNSDRRVAGGVAAGGSFANVLSASGGRAEARGTVGRSLVIGRVRGIDIKVHPTFLLVLPWVALNWGYLGGYGVAGAGFGLVLVLILFAFVVLHELGHSLLALHYGVGVRDITLLPIGGVARIEQYRSIRGAKSPSHSPGQR